MTNFIKKNTYIILKIHKINIGVTIIFLTIKNEIS